MKNAVLLLIPLLLWAANIYGQASAISGTGNSPHKQQLVKKNAPASCAETPAPWTEDFELPTFPPTCWDINSGSGEWTYTTTASGYTTGTASAFADFYNISGAEPFALFTLPFNNGSLTSPTLSFDYAYATYIDEVDELDILYSIDGGANFLLLMEMPGGLSGILNTAGATTFPFVPTTADQWSTQTIALPAGTNMIAFNAISAYGNCLYLDNVKIIQGLTHDVGVSGLDPRDIYPTGTLPVATVRNYGGTTETFTVTMTIGTYSSDMPVTLGPGLSQMVTFAPLTAAVGDYTATVTTQLTGDENTANNVASKAIKVMILNKQVYGYTTFSLTDNGPITFNLNNPGTITEIVNAYPLTYPSGGTWANNAWYATIFATAAPYNLVTFNTTTGARTIIGNMGININALSFNIANNTMYGAGYNGTNSLLYTISLTTGTATLVGTIGPQLIINMAINNAGVCYATDIIADKLGTVNLTTGVFTPVGSIGFDANYAQDMEFDHESGELYMAAYGATGELRWVNQATGNTLLVGGFQGGAEVTGFAIPYSGNKTLTVKTFLEGLYAGGGIMNQAMNELGPHFSPGIADQVTVQLHTDGNYPNIVYSSGLVALSTAGIVTVSDIPSAISGACYITIRHRNGIETTSGAPVSFAVSPVSYDFSTASSQAFGNNMKLMGTVYAIYGGDVTQDGIIDGEDMNFVENASTLATMGYVVEDVNGDGIVDSDDMNIVENNATMAVQAMTPP